MLNAKEEKICDKYSAVDDEGYVHCYECPLNLVGRVVDSDVACKATYHYDKKKQRWFPDD